jgi:hypothetical protein
MKNQDRTEWAKFYDKLDGGKLPSRTVPNATLTAAIRECAVGERFAPIREAMLGTKPRSKLGNQITTVDGIRFHSKLEARRYGQLKLLQSAGQVAYVLRQVPFDVATGVVYRLDFLIVWADGSITFEDVKGFVTDTSRVKIAAVQDRYGIKIRLLTRKEIGR